MIDNHSFLKEKLFKHKLDKDFHALVLVGRKMCIRIEDWENNSVKDGDYHYPA